MSSVTDIRIGLLLAAVLMQPVAAWGAGVEDTETTRAAERHLTDGEPLMLWSLEREAASARAGDTMEQIEVDAVAAETVKLTDVVPPVYFESGVAEIPASTVAELRAVLEGLKDRHNVRINLVGHADDRPLSPRLQRIYGDNAGLSEQRAGQVAEHFKAALGLAPEAVSIEWAGATRPVARAASRRRSPRA